jgi:hypothetical protein
MISKYHPAYLTDCLWSTRCGLFFISRTDGWINAYDLCYKINESTFSYKVCDSALTSMCINTKGDKLIIGDEEGKIYLLKLSKSFYSQQDLEFKKDYITKLFDRELFREKYIESLGKKKAPAKDDSTKLTKQEQMIKERVRKIDEEYTSFLNALYNKEPVKEEKKEELKVEERKMPSNKVLPKEEKEEAEVKKDNSIVKEQSDKLNNSKISQQNQSIRKDEYEEAVNKEEEAENNNSKILNNENLNMSDEKKKEASMQDNEENLKEENAEDNPQVENNQENIKNQNEDEIVENQENQNLPQGEEQNQLEQVQEQQNEQKLENAEEKIEKPKNEGEEVAE